MILGILLVYLSIKGYRAKKQKELLFLSLGFALMTVGSVLAGVLFEFLGFALLEVNIVEALMIVLGFSSLVYSVYGFK